MFMAVSLWQFCVDLLLCIVTENDMTEERGFAIHAFGFGDYGCFLVSQILITLISMLKTFES